MGDLRRWSATGAPVVAALAAVLFLACARQVVVESGPATGGGDVSEATLVGELRRLADLEATYHATHGRYTYDLAAVEFVATAGVLIDVLEAADEGFSAIATTSDGEIECVYFTGSARSPRGYATVANDVGCRP